jgi:hypothetical protein
MVQYDRPLLLPLLVFFLWLLSLIMIVYSAYLYLYEDEFFSQGLIGGLEGATARFGVILLYSVFIMIAGILILKSSPRGRQLIVMLSLLGLIHGVIVAFSDMTKGILILFLCIIVIAYMFTSRVSSIFQPIYSRKAVDAIDALEFYKKGRFLK